MLLKSLHPDLWTLAVLLSFSLNSFSQVSPDTGTSNDDDVSRAVSEKDVLLPTSAMPDHTSLRYADDHAVGAIMSPLYENGEQLSTGDMGAIPIKIPLIIPVFVFPNFDEVRWITITINIPGIPRRSKITVRGTCGATFVTPHYAITAAHCVDGRGFENDMNQDKPGEYMIGQWLEEGDSFKLETYGTKYLTGNMGDRFYINQDLDYPYWHSEGIVQYGLDGYIVYPNECEVVIRCRSKFVTMNESLFCRQGKNGPVFDADIALVHCYKGRSDTSTYYEVADDVSNNDSVVNLWFHEIVKDRSWTGEIEKHYINNAHHEDNYHYLDSWTDYKSPLTRADDVIHPKQLFPLISQPWQPPYVNEEKERKIVELSYSIYESGADLYGCHGTSGSGVFKGNSKNLDNLKLLGPMVHGPLVTGLCIDIADTRYREGNTSVTFTSLEFTQAIADAAYILEDENYGFDHETFYNW